MIVCDTGPIVSAINKGEKRRHLFAAELLARLGRKVMVPWPVLVETDLELALKFGKRYEDSGADLPDLIVMAMAHHRKARIVGVWYP